MGFILKVSTGSGALMSADLMRSLSLPALSLSSEQSARRNTAGCHGEHSDSRRPFHHLQTSRIGPGHSDGRFCPLLVALDAWTFSEAAK